MPSVLMSSILNLYPKKFNPDFIFIGLFLLRIPQSIQDHLLALDLDENPDVLARKVNQLFQSHQAKPRPCPNTGVIKPSLLPKQSYRRSYNSSFCPLSTQT